MRQLLLLFLFLCCYISSALQVIDAKPGSGQNNSDQLGGFTDFEMIESIQIATKTTVVSGHEFINLNYPLSNFSHFLIQKARYSTVPQHKVTFDLDGKGTTTDLLEQTLYEGENAIAPKVYSSAGWYFTGWDTSFNNVTSDVTVKALYNQLSTTYTVTFDLGEHGSSGDSLITSVYENYSADPPNVTANEGWYFTGWDSPLDNIISDKTIKAQYTQNNGVKEVFSGPDYSFYLKMNGDLWGMGKNEHGQLGNGTTVNQNKPVFVADKVRTVLTDAGTTYFIKMDNSLWGTGWNEFGQLGDGTKVDKLSPILISQNVSSVQFYASSPVLGLGGVNRAVTFFIKTDGSLWHMGQPGLYQSQYSLEEGIPAPRIIDERVYSVLHNLGASYFIKIDGSLWAYGQNSYGQLGDGTVAVKQDPVLVSTNVKSVVSDDRATFFIQNDGNLWSMGRNDYGQLGDGSKTHILNPKLLSSSVVSANIFGRNSYFIKSDSSLWGIGQNSDGQIGDGTNNEVLSPKLISNNVSKMTSLDSFIKTDGSLWELGRGSLSPVMIASDVVDAQYTNYNSYFIKSDNSLWGKGWNNYGQLGDGTNDSKSSPSLISQDVTSLHVSFYKEVYANMEADSITPYFIKSDGTLWGMGENDFGQLGDGTFINRNVLTQIDGAHYHKVTFVGADGLTWSSDPLTVRAQSGDLVSLPNYSIDSGWVLEWDYDLATPITKDTIISAQTNFLLDDFVGRFYRYGLGREPDEAGLNDWVNQFTSHTIGGADLAKGFILSQEFVDRNLSDSDFLDILYLCFFDRSSDTIGKQNWLNSISAGMTREQVLEGFLDSAEFVLLATRYGISIDSGDPVERFVTRFYNYCLQRDPDQAGLNDWVSQLKAGTKGGSDIAKGFIFSSEFMNRNLSNEDFLNVLYRAFFGREGDPVGFESWLIVLNSGLPRYEVLDGFLGAEEFVNLCSQYGIQRDISAFSDEEPNYQLASTITPLNHDTGEPFRVRSQDTQYENSDVTFFESLVYSNENFILSLELSSGDQVKVFCQHSEEPEFLQTDAESYIFMYKNLDSFDELKTHFFDFRIFLVELLF